MTEKILDKGRLSFHMGIDVFEGFIKLDHGIRNVMPIFNILPRLRQSVDFTFELLRVIRELFAHLEFDLSVYFIYCVIL